MMALGFFGLILLSGMLFKGASLALRRHTLDWEFLAQSPLPAYGSWKRSRRLSPLERRTTLPILAKQWIFSLAIVAVAWVAHFYLFQRVLGEAFGDRKFLSLAKSYGFIPLAIALIALFSNFFRFFTLGLTSMLIRPGFGAPWRLKSVTDFWARRWNIWMSEWLNEVIFRRLSRKFGPRPATFFVFLFSGVWHELLLSLPFELSTGKNLWGYCIVYFMIQYLGVVGQKRGFFPKGQKLWAVLIVALPTPLILGEPLLRAFGLW